MEPLSSLSQKQWPPLQVVVKKEMEGLHAEARARRMEAVKVVPLFTSECSPVSKWILTGR